MLDKYYIMPEKQGFDLDFGEIFKIKIDDRNIRDVLSLGLYRDYTAGIRELYANALNASMTAKEKYGADPTIEIKLDTANAKLEILEHDSMGMTRETFKNIYCILGRSGNFDGNKPGMFGVGMAAYRSLSDIMIIELFSRESNERMTFLCDNMIEFKELTKSNPSTLDTFGTKITMTLRPPRSFNNFSIDTKPDFPFNQTPLMSMYESIMESVSKYAKFSGIPTLLSVPENINAVSFPIGMYPIVGRNKGINQHYLGPINVKDGIRGKTFISIDNDDFRIDVSGRGHCDTTLAGMPIKHQGLPFVGYVLRIKNERKYLPTVSRDELTFEAENDINRLVIEKVAKEIIKMGRCSASVCIKRFEFFKLLWRLKRFIKFCNRSKCEYSLSPLTEKRLKSVGEIWEERFSIYHDSKTLSLHIVDLISYINGKSNVHSNDLICAAIADNNASYTDKNDLEMINEYLGKFPKNHVIFEINSTLGIQKIKRLSTKLTKAGIPNMKSF